MSSPASAGYSSGPPALSEQDAWDIVVLMAGMAPALAAARERLEFAWHLDQLETPADTSVPGMVAWEPDRGWELLLPASQPRHGMLALWLPLCSALPARPLAVGHLGQSIDGFIATLSGDSQFVTGHENILHLHRLRALCSAVIVGAGTVAYDNPRLTTRHVEGPNPLRVIFDPARRLEGDYHLFTDMAAPTLYACGRRHLKAGETAIGHASVLPLESDVPVSAAAELVDRLRERGCFRLFVEGGGVTVSSFVEAGVLDRLHIAIAPVIIGTGRPAIRLPGHDTLRDCVRPGYRVFRMGGDVLFDCDLRSTAPGVESTGPSVALVI